MISHRGGQALVREAERGQSSPAHRLEDRAGKGGGTKARTVLAARQVSRCIRPKAAGWVRRRSSLISCCPRVLSKMEITLSKGDVAIKGGFIFFLAASGLSFVRLSPRLGEPGSVAMNRSSIGTNQFPGIAIGLLAVSAARGISP